MLQKRIQIRAEWWLKMLRDRRCCVPGCMEEHSEVHHLCKMRWRDDYGVNMCKGHHTFFKDSIHVLGDVEFMQAHGFNIFEYWLKVLIPEYEAIARARV